MKKIAVILAGCGNRDGSETHETLSVLLAIDKRGMEYQCFAPEGDFSVFNHIKGEPTGEKRNLMTEASRLCRGNIKPLSEYCVNDMMLWCYPAVWVRLKIGVITLFVEKK